MCARVYASVVSFNTTKLWLFFTLNNTLVTIVLSRLNCGRVYVCVFLLSTAHHRNGEPVSTATLFCVNLQRGWMLHVTNYSGNVVLVLCIFLSPASSILLLLGFWAAYHHPLAKSHVIRGHGGSVWLSTCSYDTCMCLSLLLSYIFLKTCPHLPRVS